MSHLARITLFLAAITTAAIAGRAGEPARVSNFFNVVSPTGADPWILRRADGWYYATITTGSNVTLVRSRTISALGAGERKRVYVPPPGMKHLWAPELHWIDQAWYVYFAADNGDNANHRIFVLENASTDPFQGTFASKGKLAVPAADRWAIDGSLLQVQDRSYFVWSGWEGTEDVEQAIYIAPMASPSSLAGRPVRISRPTLPWEQSGGPPSVNEGPEVLVHGEHLFLVYSAAGSWSDHYALGLLTLTPGRDPLLPSSWTKSQSPIFASANGVFAPGHCSFTKSPDGREDWIVYHAAKRSGSGWSRLIRAQPFDWNTDGTPNFGVPWPPNTPLALPGGEPPRIRVEAETAALTGAAHVTRHPTASGGAKVAGIQAPDGSASLTVTAPAAGSYILVIRSCNGSPANAVASHSVSINGGKPLIVRYENCGWDNWSNAFTKAGLQAGVNTLRFTPRDNRAELDCVDVIPP